MIAGYGTVSVEEAARGGCMHSEGDEVREKGFIGSYKKRAGRVS